MDYKKQKLLMELHEMTHVPDEWTEFDGNYKKNMQDIRLKDGTELLACWPNAGMFHVTGTKHDPVLCSEVTHVKKSKNW